MPLPTFANNRNIGLQPKAIRNGAGALRWDKVQQSFRGVS